MDESAREMHRNIRLTERGARARALALAFGLAVMLASLAASAAQARGTAVTNAVAGCQAITITFSGFPNLPNNTVTEQVRSTESDAPWCTHRSSTGPRALTPSRSP
jgi:hypothetical protein